MDSHSAVIRILKLLNEAKKEAADHDYRTLTYFIDMALVQAQDDASKPKSTTVESNDINKKAC